MKILILGIGNILFGDEGVGVHLANLLKLNYTFKGKNGVTIIDGGTLAQRLIPIITEYNYVIILDCIDVNDAKIGDVYCFDFSKIPNSITWSGSAHEVEMLQTLNMIEMMGDLPPTKIIGVKPYIIGTDPTFHITDEVINAAKTMEQLVLNELKKLEVEIIKTDTKELQEVANFSYKGY